MKYYTTTALSVSSLIVNQIGGGKLDLQKCGREENPEGVGVNHLG